MRVIQPRLSEPLVAKIEFTIGPTLGNLGVDVRRLTSPLATKM